MFELVSIYNATEFCHTLVSVGVAIYSQKMKPSKPDLSGRSWIIRQFWPVPVGIARFDTVHKVHMLQINGAEAFAMYHIKGSWLAFRQCVTSR